MVLLRVDFEPLAKKLQELLDKNGVVDIICIEHMYGIGTPIPMKIIRVKRSDTKRRIDQALLQTIHCHLIELKVIEQ